jgi:hypothetical protein
MSDPTINSAQEARLLRDLFAIFDGPWGCGACGQPITAETGWKPSVGMIFREGVGVWRTIVDIRCGGCKGIPFSVEPPE